VQCTLRVQRDVKMTMRMTTFDVMMLLTLMTPVSSTHFHGAHFWFQPADYMTPDQPAVSCRTVNFAQSFLRYQT